MKRKTIASILIIAMAVSMLVSGCGNKNKEKNTEKNSEAVSEAETETESEIDTEKETESQASSETEIESETQVATNDNSEKESEKVDEKESEKVDEKESEKADENNEPTKPTHTCNFATLNSDANNHWYVCSCGKTANSASHGYTDEYDADCNTCGYIRSVPERPVEPETPSVPGSSVNWNGGDITLENVGIKIPTLTEFNKTGLESSDKDWWWTGHEDDKQALSSMNRIYLTCDNFADALVSQGWGANGMNAFSVSQNRIWFSWDDGSYEDFSLARHGGTDGGYYELTINMSLKSEDYFGIDVAPWNRDVVKTLCSFVSSTPTELYNALYEDLHGTTFISDSGWTTIGDCKVQFDDTSSSGHIRYFIKAK